MPQLAISVLVSSAIFFALMLGFDVFFRSAAFNAETIFANVFKTLVFAMAFGALKVGMLIFRKDNQ